MTTPIKYLALFLATLLAGVSCKTIQGDSSTTPNQSDSIPDTSVIRLPDEGLGDPDPEPFAPALRSALVFAQGMNPAQSRRALVTGLPGAADVAKGVNEIVIQNQSGTIVKVAPEADGSFRAIVSAAPQEKLSLWTNGVQADGSAYAAGSATANGIQETVTYWSLRFPHQVNVAVAGRVDGNPVSFVGSHEGLFAIQEGDLEKNPTEIFPIHFDASHGLGGNDVTALLYESATDRLWIGAEGHVQSVEISDGALHVSHDLFLNGEKIQALARVGSDELLLVGTDQALRLMDAGTDAATLLSDTNCDPVVSSNCLPESSINKIVADGNGGFWIGASGTGELVGSTRGLYHLTLSGSSSLFQRYGSASCTTASASPCLSLVDVLDLAQIGNQLLIGQASGLTRMTVDSRTGSTQFENLLKNKRVNSISAAVSGEAWIAVHPSDLYRLTVNGSASRINLFWHFLESYFTTVSALAATSEGFLAGAKCTNVDQSCGMFRVDLTGTDVVTTQYSLYNELPSNRVQSLWMDGRQNGQMAIGTSEGLATLDLTKKEVRRYQANPKCNVALDFCAYQEMPALNIRDQVQDSNGGTWLAQSKGLAHLNLDGFLKEISLIGQQGFGKIEEAFGMLWMVPDFPGRGLVRARMNSDYQPSGVETYTDVLPSDLIYDLAVSHANGQEILWVATSAGLVRVTEMGANTYQFTRMEQVDSHLGQSIFEILAHEDGLWLSFSDHLDYFDITKSAMDGPSNPIELPVRDDTKSLGKGRVVSMAASSDGFLWLGTNQGTGLRKIERTVEGQHTVKGSWTTTDGLPSAHILSLLVRDDGSVIFGTPDGQVGLFVDGN